MLSAGLFLHALVELPTQRHFCRGFAHGCSNMTTHPVWPCVVFGLVLLQVSVAEERHRGLKEALEVDIASIGGQADKIKVSLGPN